MKNIIILFFLMPAFMFAQAPQSFNYQTVLRGDSGLVLSNTDIDFTLEILQDATVVHTENHIINTGEFGLINIQVGIQSPDSFSDIDWSDGTYTLKVFVDDISIGESPIIAVPYALYAERAGSANWTKTDTTLFFLEPGVKVGIGTSSPAEAFEVRGRMRLSSDSHYKLDLVTTDSGKDNIIRSFDENYNGLWTINLGDRDEQDNFYIDRPLNGKYDFIIDSNGNVGIGLSETLGNNSPDAPLDLRGWQKISNAGFSTHSISNPSSYRILEGLSPILGLQTGSAGGQNYGLIRTYASGLPTVSIGSNQNISTNGEIIVSQITSNTSSSKASIFIDEDGNGVIEADIKHFTMDYPNSPDKEIWYACLEGPEAAAYERGSAALTNGEAIIEFSEHYKLVINPATMTVQITPHSSNTYGLSVIEKTDNGFKVKELMDGVGNFSFDWEVKCVRKGFENYRPVRDKR